MIPGLNPRDVEKAMKRMGIKQEPLDATEVIIKCVDKDLVIRDPQVMKVNMMGQETLQITGTLEELSRQSYTDADVKTVIEQAHVSAAEAKKALELFHGDLAAAILSFQK